MELFFEMRLARPCGRKRGKSGGRLFPLHSPACLGCALRLEAGNDKREVNKAIALGDPPPPLKGIIKPRRYMSVCTEYLFIVLLICCCS